MSLSKGLLTIGLWSPVNNLLLKWRRGQFKGAGRGWLAMSVLSLLLSSRFRMGLRSSFRVDPISKSRIANWLPKQLINPTRSFLLTTKRLPSQIMKRIQSPWWRAAHSTHHCFYRKGSSKTQLNTCPLGTTERNCTQNEIISFCASRSQLSRLMVKYLSWAASFSTSIIRTRTDFFRSRRRKIILAMNLDLLKNMPTLKQLMRTSSLMIKMAELKILTNTTKDGSNFLSLEKLRTCYRANLHSVISLPILRSRYVEARQTTNLVWSK